MHEWHLEAVEVQVGEPVARENAGRAVVVRVDVRHDKAANPPRANLLDSGVDRGNRLVGVHPAIQQVDRFSVREKKDVDEAILKRNRQAQLVNVRRHLCESGLGRHVRNCRRAG